MPSRIAIQTVPSKFPLSSFDYHLVKVTGYLQMLPESRRANSMLSLRAIPINRGRTQVLRKRLEVNLFGRSWRQYRLQNFRNYLKLSLPFFLSVRTLLLLAIRLIYSCKEPFLHEISDRLALHAFEIQACSLLLDDIILWRVFLYTVGFSTVMSLKLR